MNRGFPNGGTETETAEKKPGKPAASGFTVASNAMDIARPDIARKKRRRRIAWGTAAVAALAGITFVLMRLEPAVPGVDSGTLMFDNVRRGELIRNVRGNGTLVPEQIQYVQADTGGLVDRIFILPGAEVKSDTVILELSNPDLKQSAFDAEWKAKAAEATLAKLKNQLESDRLAQESKLVTLRADAKQGELEAKADEVLLKDGLVPLIQQQKSRAHADDLAGQVGIEEKILQFAKDSEAPQVAVQEADLENLRALRDLKKKQVEELRVRAGIDGVLTQLGDKEVLQSGQRVAPSATLAKVVVPSRLKAEIKVAETQARDVTHGQKVEVDTRNGVVMGHVIRVDPAVQNGTVQVDVALDGPLPKGARPDLSVEGTIELDRVENVLNTGRPVQGQPDSTIGIYKVVEGGKYAVRVPVKLGRTSVTSVEIVDGLGIGDRIILSDMSQWDAHPKVKLN